MPTLDSTSTGERIRDKIAASKAKGMWMGSLVPLNYDPPDGSGDRRMRVNETEAVAVPFNDIGKIDWVFLAA